MVQISAQSTNRKSPWLVTPSFPTYSISFCKMEMIPRVPSHFGASFNSEASSGRVVSVHLLSGIRLSVTPWKAAHQAPLSSQSPGVCPYSSSLSGQGEGGENTRTPRTGGVMPQACALGRTRCDVGISQGPPHYAEGDSSIFKRNFFFLCIMVPKHMSFFSRCSIDLYQSWKKP